MFNNKTNDSGLNVGETIVGEMNPSVRWPSVNWNNPVGEMNVDETSFSEMVVG